MEADNKKVLAAVKRDKQINNEVHNLHLLEPYIAQQAYRTADCPTGIIKIYENAKGWGLLDQSKRDRLKTLLEDYCSNKENKKTLYNQWENDIREELTPLLNAADPNDILNKKDQMLAKLTKAYGYYRFIQFAVMGATLESISKYPPDVQAKLLMQDALKNGPPYVGAASPPPRKDHPLGRFSAYVSDLAFENKSAMEKLPGFKEIIKQHITSYLKDLNRDKSKELLAVMDGVKEPSFRLRRVAGDLISQFEFYDQVIQYAIKDAIAEHAGIRLMP